MAHHAHSIPWQTLADNLKFMHCNPRNPGITNLYVRKRPDRDKQLQYSAVGFARALSAYSEVERKKYRPSFISPEQDERVVSETAARDMSAMLLRGRGELDAPGVDGPPDEGLSDYECTPRHFISATYHCGGDMNHEIQRCCEQTKIMLLCDEMNALFWLAAHPNVYFYRLWDGDIYGNAAGFGLKKLMDTMLQAYLCLNVLVLKPELYDATSRTNFLHTEEKAHRTAYTLEAYDYRLTAAYQRMLLCCMGFSYGVGHHEAHTYPHREFFGVPRETYYFGNPFWEQRAVRPGTGRVENLTEQKFRHAYLVSKADVEAVLDLLRKKSLPTKLALQILKLAEYRSTGRLWIRDDSLHSVNTQELKMYLSFCWKVLVLLDMLVKECGRTLDWESEVADGVCTLFEVGHSGRPKGRLRETCDMAEFGKRSQRVCFVSQ